jgi:hypothetical protein
MDRRHGANGGRLVRLKVGDLIARDAEPTALFRVTSIAGTAANGYVRLLPYRRQGAEAFIAKHRGRWIGADGRAWSKIA